MTDAELAADCLAFHRNGDLAPAAWEQMFIGGYRLAEQRLSGLLEMVIATERGKLEAADAENDRLAARVAELEQGMREIRFSGHNEPAIAIWMQKVAAHAMEPKQWPHPGSFPGADGTAARISNLNLGKFEDYGSGPVVLGGPEVGTDSSPDADGPKHD